MRGAREINPSTSLDRLETDLLSTLERAIERNYAGGLCRSRDSGGPDAPRTDPYVENCCIPIPDAGIKAHVRMQVQDLRTRKPKINQRPEPFPGHPVSLAPPPKRRYERQIS
jgi:hypothetical protein